VCDARSRACARGGGRSRGLAAVYTESRPEPSDAADGASPGHAGAIQLVCAERHGSWGAMTQAGRSHGRAGAFRTTSRVYVRLPTQRSTTNDAEKKASPKATKSRFSILMLRAANRNSAPAIANMTICAVIFTSHFLPYNLPPGA